MSETVSKPPADTSLASWHKAMKQAFDVKGKAAAKGAVEAGIAPRLATLRHTFDNVRAQAPELAIRPMQEIANELAISEMALNETGAGLPPEAAKFRREVDAELDGLKAKAGGIVADHVRDWQAEYARLPPAGKERAGAIQKWLARVEPGVVRDVYMLQQVGARPTALQAINEQAQILKLEYEAMRPKRTTAGDPQPAAAVTKPDIKGTLTGPETATLLTNLQKTQALMGKDEAPNPETLDATVALIGKGIDAVRAEAEVQRLKSWVAIKDEYHRRAEADPAAGKAYMAEMWWYRRKTVDGLMSRLQRQYDFIWGSVGSDNPESDYDLTVRTHPKKPVKGDVEWDYQVVQKANEALSADYGVPPGILFDTNLYAEAQAKTQVLTPEQQASPAVKAMSAMKEQGQDVGALMKLRRFMEWDDYEAQKTEILKAITVPADRALVQRQFEEADARYFMALAAQLRKAAEQDSDKTRGATLNATLDRIPQTPEGQRQLAALAEELEHDAARSMAANNAIYAERLTAVRTLEQQYDAEADPAKKAGLLARLKTDQADATFFAAEAYHSEGPLQHVVKAGQSSKLEIEGDGNQYTPQQKAAAIEAKKAEKLEALSANQMLQSFNENLGDLLKDLKHYGTEPYPGLGFYRCSKYIERLCDAVSVIAPKLEDTARDAVLAVPLGDKSAKVVQGRLGNLVDIRGDKKSFATLKPPPADPELEKQAYAVAEMSTIFPGVITLPDLAKQVTTYGQKVNAIVRKAIAKDMHALNSNPYFPAPLP